MSKADLTSRSKGIDINRKMPLTQRRRRPLMMMSSSPTTTTVDAQGTAYLCFAEDHSWFQGNISTDDESNYSLYGERLCMPNEEEARPEKKAIADNNNNEDKCDNGNEEESQDTEFYYRVTLIDHFSGQKYVLPKIFAPQPESSSNGVGLCFKSLDGEVTFKVENAFRGQKADIMIQRFLACPALLGKRCMLYTGEINILYNDVGETGKSWSL